MVVVVVSSARRRRSSFFSMRWCFVGVGVDDGVSDMRRDGGQRRSTTKRSLEVVCDEDIGRSLFSLPPNKEEKKKKVFVFRVLMSRV